MQQFFYFPYTHVANKLWRIFEFFFFNGFQPHLLVVQANDFFFSDGLNSHTILLRHIPPVNSFHKLVTRRWKIAPFWATVFWCHTSLHPEIFWNNGAFSCECFWLDAIWQLEIWQLPYVCILIRGPFHSHPPRSPEVLPFPFERLPRRLISAHLSHVSSWSPVRRDLEGEVRSCLP